MPLMGLLYLFSLRGLAKAVVRGLLCGVSLLSRLDDWGDPIGSRRRTINLLDIVVFVDQDQIVQIA
jgi:hypothetical protein